jgi:glutathione S-transferase
MGPSDIPKCEDPAHRSVGPVEGGLATCLVCQRHPPLSEPDQQPAQGLRRNGRVRQRDKFATEGLFENFRIADDILAGREYFFDHFTAPDAHFFWCCRRATQLEVDLSGFPNVAAHFKRMQERPSVKKLLAFEKEVNEGFANTA